jgi:hypothetical protein
VLRDPLLLEELYPYRGVQLARNAEDSDTSRRGPACYEVNGYGAVTFGV